MTSRRSLLAALATTAASAAFPAWAQQNRAGVRDVVKILSFSCPVCHASEAQDVAIRAEVERRGGRFVPAPVPTVAAETGAKERVYYASRDISQPLSQRIKESLYRASQELQIVLPDFNATHVWLQSDLSAADQQHLPRLFQMAQEPASLAALRRAVNLVQLAGVESVPCYIVMEAGTVVRALDPTHVREGSLTALRQAVIDALSSDSSTKS